MPFEPAQSGTRRSSRSGIIPAQPVNSLTVDNLLLGLNRSMVMLKAPNDWLTVTQAAARLKTTRQNIHDAISRGRLNATKVGSMLLINRGSLDAYGKSRKRTGRPSTKKKKR